MVAGVTFGLSVGEVQVVLAKLYTESGGLCTMGVIRLAALLDFRAKVVLHATGFFVESDVIVWDVKDRVGRLFERLVVRGVVKKIKS